MESKIDWPPGLACNHKKDLRNVAVCDGTYMMPRLKLSELLGHEETEKQRNEYKKKEDRNKQVNKTSLVVKKETRL